MVVEYHISEMKVGTTMDFDFRKMWQSPLMTRLGLTGLPF